MKKECEACTEVSGFYLGMTCPKCKQPFRDVKVKYTNEEYLDLHGSAENAYLKQKITSQEYIKMPEKKRNHYMRYCGSSEVYYILKP